VHAGDGDGRLDAADGCDGCNDYVDDDDDPSHCGHSHANDEHALHDEPH